MSEEEKAVAHEDIWDDSALVDSWNQALEEYKKYHSIHADKAAEATIVPDSQNKRSPWNNTLQNAKTETNELQSPPNGSGKNVETNHQQDKNAGEISVGFGVNDQQPGALGSPISVLGSVKDDGLKSLLMSWYYAGYYTGLYEGQQKSQQG